jgi:hypothetical protein
VRHLREKHEASFVCSHLDGCNYEWAGSRKYEYRNHLKKKHELEDDKIEEILDEPPRCRRGRDNVAESDQVAGHPEPEITTTEHDDSSGLEHLAATHAPSALLSKEEFALLRGYYRNHGHFRFVHTFLCATFMIDSVLRFPSVHPGRSTQPMSHPIQGYKLVARASWESLLGPLLT